MFRYFTDGEKFSIWEQILAISGLELSREQQDVIVMLDEEHSEELRALRNLERTVRAWSITASVLPAQKRQEMLAGALREVVEARKRAMRRSRPVSEK